MAVDVVFICEISLCSKSRMSLMQKDQELGKRRIMFTLNRLKLKLNGMEAQLFAIKTESLQADNRRLEAQVADCSRVVGELEASRTKIKMLKRKLRLEAEQSKQ
ncbi:hypothetical protein QQ045_016415 [Rhodiola kirilowii]